MILWVSDIGLWNHWALRCPYPNGLPPSLLIQFRALKPFKRKKKKKKTTFSQRKPRPALINSILSDLARPCSLPEACRRLYKSKVPRAHQQVSVNVSSKDSEMKTEEPPPSLGQTLEWLRKELVRLCVSFYLMTPPHTFPASLGSPLRGPLAGAERLQLGCRSCRLPLIPAHSRRLGCWDK